MFDVVKNEKTKKKPIHFAKLKYLPLSYITWIVTAEETNHLFFKLLSRCLVNEMELAILKGM